MSKVYECLACNAAFIDNPRTTCPACGSDNIKETSDYEQDGIVENEDEIREAFKHIEKQDVQQTKES